MNSQVLRFQGHPRRGNHITIQFQKGGTEATRAAEERVTTLDTRVRFPSPSAGLGRIGSEGYPCTVVVRSKQTRRIGIRGCPFGTFSGLPGVGSVTVVKAGKVEHWELRAFSTYVSTLRLPNHTWQVPSPMPRHDRCHQNPPYRHSASSLPVDVVSSAEVIATWQHRSWTRVRSSSSGAAHSVLRMASSRSEGGTLAYRRSNPDAAGQIPHASRSRRNSSVSPQDGSTQSWPQSVSRHRQVLSCGRLRSRGACSLIGPRPRTETTRRRLAPTSLID
ncbi:hypothetical protein R1flu_022688 [Riccia fluitans]|uniref:Uncharacterized protein n=1 Tax=Riccia fluitans TaxID=41844 RepID=A0ABD1XST0_9MARC